MITHHRLISLPPPPLPFLRSRAPLMQLWGLGSAGSGAEPQLKSNFVHFSLKIWHLVATILMIFLIINKPHCGGPKNVRVACQKRCRAQFPTLNPRPAGSSHGARPRADVPRGPGVIHSSWLIMAVGLLYRLKSCKTYLAAFRWTISNFSMFSSVYELHTVEAYSSCSLTYDS